MAKAKRSLVAVLCGLALLLVIIVPVLSRAREQAQRSSCGNNLGNLVKCCMLYADVHGGRWPEKLSQLYPGYVRDLRVFKCPGAPGPGILTAEDIDTRSSYAYHPERIQTDGAVACVIEDKPGNHPGAGRNVAIAAGSVEWWDNASRRATRGGPGGP